MAKNVKRNTAEAPLRPATPATHWKKLRQGDRVRVLLTPGFETGGVVDAVTADNTVVWINLDGGRGRTLLHCGDGIEIFRHED